MEYAFAAAGAFTYLLDLAQRRLFSQRTMTTNLRFTGK